MAKALADINGFKPRMHQPQAQLGILADAPLRPAADIQERLFANQSHRSVLDNGIALIPVNHSDLKKPMIFKV